MNRLGSIVTSGSITEERAFYPLPDLVKISHVFENLLVPISKFLLY